MNGFQLFECEERFRATFEQTAVGMAHISPGGRWLQVNRRLCDMLGYAPENLTKLGFRDITPPENWAADLAMQDRLLSGSLDIATAERQCISADGSRIWAKITISLGRTFEGEPSYFIAVIEDISHEKEIEAQLLRMQRRMGQAADGVEA